MLTKEQFVKYLTALQNGYGRREKFNNAMEAYSDSYFTSSLGEEWANALIELLNINMGLPEDSDIVTWFLFDRSEKKFYFKNQNGSEEILDVSTPEKLYDGIIRLLNIH